MYICACMCVSEKDKTSAFQLHHTVLDSVSKYPVIQGNMNPTIRLFIISLCLMHSTISAGSMRHPRGTTEDYHEGRQQQQEQQQEQQQQQQQQEQQQHDLIDEQERDFHRELPECASASKSLYNAAVNLFTNSAVNCPKNQATLVENFIRRRFDKIVNNSPNFQGRLRLKTNFCSDNRRLSETTGAGVDVDGQDSLFADDIEMVEDSLMMENTTDDGLNRELWSVFRDPILIMSIFVRGNGKCFFCWDDNGDFNSRKLVGGNRVGKPQPVADMKNQRKLNTPWVDYDTFYDETVDMEKLLNRRLTKGLRLKFNSQSGHCLKGKDPAVSVHIIPHKETGLLTKCGEQPSMHCCAPRKDPTDACSKTEFASWYCHETESSCTDECNGMWVDSLNPPTNCLGEWSDCTNGGTCCDGFHCRKKNDYYSQCKV